MPPRVLLAIDEAYIEFLDEPFDLLPEIRNGSKPNLILMRTFSKIYGLAGLRLGYGIGNPDFIAELEKIRQPFNVNAVAQAGALAALDDTAHAEKTRRNTLRGLKLYARAFRRLGLEFVPSGANFILVRVGDGQRVFNDLQKQGVIVRPMASYQAPGMDSYFHGHAQAKPAVSRSFKTGSRKRLGMTRPVRERARGFEGFGGHRLLPAPYADSGEPFRFCRGATAEGSRGLQSKDEDELERRRGATLDGPACASAQASLRDPLFQVHRLSPPQPSPRGEGNVVASVERRGFKNWVNHWLRQVFPKPEGESSPVGRRIPARYSVKRSRVATPSPWGEGWGDGEQGAAGTRSGPHFPNACKAECRGAFRPPPTTESGAEPPHSKTLREERTQQFHLKLGQNRILICRICDPSS